MTTYLHGTDAEEQARLAAMNGLINASSLEALGPCFGDRVLEIGSGLGLFARAIARVTHKPVVCVERSEEQVQRAAALAAEAGESGLIEQRVGLADAPPILEAELGSFDIVHARFLLEHVHDPQKVVNHMARFVKPGGRVVLEDDDHAQLRLWPDAPRVMANWQGLIRVYDRLACDPFVGRRLTSLLHAAGCSPRRVRMLPFHACAGDPLFPAVIANLRNIFVGARAHIIATGAVDAALFAAGLDELAQFASRPDGVLWYAINWAEAVRPTPA